MIEEYNHGKEFPTLKSLPGLRFRRRAETRESSKSVPAAVTMTTGHLSCCDWSDLFVNTERVT